MGIINITKNPIIVNLEITNSCNLNCIFCRAEANKHLDNNLSKDEIINLFTDLKSLGIKYLSLTGGEPLIRKDFEEIAKMANIMGFKLSLSTNGTLIKRIPIDILKLFNPIRISLDGSVSEVHDSIRRVNGAYNQTIEAITYLISIGIYPTIRFTITKNNLHELDALIKLSSQLGIKKMKINRVIPIFMSNINVEDIQISPEEYKVAIENANVLAQKNNISLGSEDPVTFQLFNKYDKMETTTFGGCSAGITQIYITSRGDVLPCPYLPIKIGSIRKIKLSKLLKIKNSNKFFMNMKSNVKGKCGSCKFKMLCSGCRAAALYNTGDLLAPDPMCLIPSLLTNADLYG